MATYLPEINRGELYIVMHICEYARAVELTSLYMLFLVTVLKLHNYVLCDTHNLYNYDADLNSALLQINKHDYIDLHCDVFVCYVLYHALLCMYDVILMSCSF